MTAANWSVVVLFASLGLAGRMLWQAFKHAIPEDLRFFVVVTVGKREKEMLYADWRLLAG
ncbi:MAG: hypothetical protein DMG38_17865 [Acidobacteria bacterium]|nr:MAG: hypothetical protein DMG38_17865 [Acidobacteriota bacterium]